MYVEVYLLCEFLLLTDIRSFKKLNRNILKENLNLMNGNTPYQRIFPLKNIYSYKLNRIKEYFYQKYFFESAT